jgi:hypothetical protein
VGKINLEKILGYLLLLLGLVTIAYSTLSVINVFQGRTEPFNLFSFSAISLDFSEMVKGQPIPPGTNLEQELMSEDVLNKPINTAAHLMLMGFLASVGLKVANIGTMLIRPIKVKLIGNCSKKPL